MNTTPFQPSPKAAYRPYPPLVQDFALAPDTKSTL
ncbi:MAG: hypothetical protein ACI9SK_001071 [Zhongshania sp.]|jgi:hypothetical protein